MLSVAETLLAFVPLIRSVPIIFRLLRSLGAIGAAGSNDAQAIEALQRSAQQRKTDRQTRIERNGRYVLKASDAMQCVEDAVADGAILFSLGKAMINAVLGRQVDVVDILTDRIFDCIESKVLAQTGRRRKKSNKRWYGRPAVGHGAGRK